MVVYVVDLDIGLGGCILVVLDVGVCQVGLELIIIGWQGGQFVLLRLGGIFVEQIEVVLGQLLMQLVINFDVLNVSGQLISYYVLCVSLWLNVSDVVLGELLIGFGFIVGEILFSVSGDIIEVVVCLFEMLYYVDVMGCLIVVVFILDVGLGVVINDWLCCVVVLCLG